MTGGINFSHYFSLQGTCTWIVSILGVLMNLGLIGAELRRRKYSTSTLFVILIGVSGIISLATDQSPFLQVCLRSIISRGKLFICLFLLWSWQFCALS